MTISAETAVAGPYNGDGSTTAFTFAFKCFSTSDLAVWLESSAAVQTLKTLTTDYTVSLNADQDTSPGGTVTMITAPASGEKLHIVSDIALTRSDNFSNSGGFYPNVLNDARDKTTLQIQQINDKLGRAVLAPVGDVVAGNLPNATSRASKYLGFDSVGDPAVFDLVNVGTTLTLGTGWASQLADPYAPSGSPTPLEDYGGGDGVAEDDQTAFETAAAAGAFVILRAGTTYYMTAGVTPIDGFGVHFEPGSKIVLVTQASGSGSAGFKNYSGLTANRNSANSTAFMLTASQATFVFSGLVHIEGDNSNQPILRPILAQNCTLYIRGTLYVRNLNAVCGALSLNGMYGGEVWGVDVLGNAEMDDSDYTDITNVGPSGVLFDDLGSTRSARMTFGDVRIVDINREAAGSDPYESDGVTLGGVDYSLRSGAVEGHFFRSIYAENVGEGFDCFQDHSIIGHLTCKDVGQYGAKFVHGAQYNTILNIDVDGFRAAGIAFCGSSSSAKHCLSNRVLGGVIQGANASAADAAPIYILDNSAGTASVPKKNVVANVDLVGASTSNYVVRSNLDATTGGAVAAGEENRVYNCPNVGSSPITAYELDAEDTVVIDVEGQYWVSSSTYAVYFQHDLTIPYATDGSADAIMTQHNYRMEDDAGSAQVFLQEFVRGSSRASGAHSGQKVWRTRTGGTTRDQSVDYDGFKVNASSGYYVGGNKVVGAQGAAITDPAGGSTVDSEARTAISAILSRLEAHGIIAT